MADSGGAYVNKASDTDFRKKWDKDEYTERAKQKDTEERERMQENEERMKQGKRPRKGTKKYLPKPTELMQAREAPLELDKNLGKTMVVQNPGGRGPGQPGFYCETCNRTYKDSVGYLDHINSRARMSLQFFSRTPCVAVDKTVEQVRARIAMLREKTKDASNARAFDFDKRLAEIKDKEQALRQDKKDQKKAEKEKARFELMKDLESDNEMTRLMGFGGFGSSKK